MLKCGYTGPAGGQGSRSHGPGPDLGPILSPAWGAEGWARLPEEAPGPGVQPKCCQWVLEYLSVGYVRVRVRGLGLGISRSG